jgi:hypothetical protein
LKLRRRLAEHGILHWHAQNLNTLSGSYGDRDAVYGSMLRQGRAWFSFGRGRSDRHPSHPTVEVNWHFPRRGESRFWHASVDVGGGEWDVSASWALGLFQVGAHFQGFFPRSWRYLPWVYDKATREFDYSRKSNPRGFIQDTWPSTTGWHWYAGSLSIELWRNSEANHPLEPKGWSWWITPKDLLLGRMSHDRRTLRVEEATLPMPERSFKAKVTFEEIIRRRPRWPWPERFYVAEIEPELPVLHPGKGENAWDCGMDATYTLSTPATTVAEAVGAFVESIYRDRDRHGGKGWYPTQEEMADFYAPILERRASGRGDS